MVNMMLQSVGKALSASVTAAARQGLFFIPFILTLPKILDLTGVFYAQPLADICTFLLSVPMAMHFLKEMKRNEK
jgi:Na+-driven multidrug efflux pump